MEGLMKNSGLSLIAEEIFLNLNIQDLVNCRLVSSFWLEFIDGHKSLVLKKLKWSMINRRSRDGKTVVEKFPEYQMVLDHFAKREDWDSTQKFFEFMKNRGKSVLAPFHMACWTGDKFLIQKLLKCCPNGSDSFNAPDRHGFTPFHRIVINGDEELLAMFLDHAEDKGIDVNALDKKRNSCLHLACVQTMTVLQRNIVPNRAKILSMLLEHPMTKRLNVNARNLYDDKTPLQLACADGNLDVVKVLLSQSVQTDSNVNEAFLLACTKGRTLVVRELLKVNNSVLNVSDGEGNVGLHWACRNGRQNVVKLLLEETQMDVNITNHLGETPFHIACKYGKLDVVNMIIEIAGNKIDINATNVQGYNALHLSCQYGSVDQILTLFKFAEAKEIELTNIPTHSGQTLLHLISNYQRSEEYKSVLSLLKELEKHGQFDPEAVSDNGNSPLHLACTGKFFTMARYIIQSCKWSKKSLNVTNVNGNTALHIACKNGDIDTVRKFMNAYFMTDIDFNAINAKGLTPLHLACYFGHNEVVAMLIEKSMEFEIDLEAKNEEDNTPLHMACSRGHIEVVKLLMNKLKSVNLSLKNTDGCTPFHIACSHGQKEIVQLLLNISKEQNIDLNMRDHQGRTPVNAVCQVIQSKGLHLIEILELLLTFSRDLKIDVNTADDKGNTPIHALLSMKHTRFSRCLSDSKILERLHQSNVRFDAVDANGNTPLHLAVMSRNLEGIDFLLNIDDDNGQNIRNQNGQTPKEMAKALKPNVVTNRFIIDAFTKHSLKARKHFNLS